MSEFRDERGAAVELRLANRLEELDKLHAFLSAVAARDGWPEKLRMELLLCCDELVTNAIHYGFPDGGEHAITLTARTEEGMAVIVMEDEGVAYDPLTESVEPDITLGVEEREIGGLGVFLVKRLAERLEYERTARGNRLVLAKALRTTS